MIIKKVEDKQKHLDDFANVIHLVELSGNKQKPVNPFLKTCVSLVFNAFINLSVKTLKHAKINKIHFLNNK